MERNELFEKERLRVNNLGIEVDYSASDDLLRQFWFERGFEVGGKIGYEKGFEEAKIREYYTLTGEKKSAKTTQRRIKK
jgi:hypothetical protein